MRPVIRGREAAASSMRAQATEAARKILAAGGNAFDAAVAGQAALGITDFADNGVGSVAASCTLPSADTASTESTAAPFRPMPPTTYMTPPSVPAEACISPCGSVPIRVTRPLDGANR